MAYAQIHQISALCRNLLGSADQFGTSTSPTIVEIQDFLTSGCAIIETYVTSWGYEVPPAATTPLYGMLSELNALYAAGQAEMTRTNIVLATNERTRGQVFNQLFWDGLTRLGKLDLAAAGADPSGGDGTGTTSGAYLYVGGISISDKESVEADTDRVVPRFKRDMFPWPGTLTTSGVSDETD